MKQGAKNLFLILFTLATLWPVFWVVKMALEPSQSFSFSFSPLPQHPSLENFRHLVTHHDSQGHWIFGRQVWNSFSASAFSTLLGLRSRPPQPTPFRAFAFPAAGWR